MNVFYERPADFNTSNYGQRVDVNGTTFWVKWNAWMSATQIDNEEAIKLLPLEIATFVPKWEKEIQRLKQEEYSLGYPIKLAKIYFIYKDIVYKLEPRAFKAGKENFHFSLCSDQVLFEGAHGMIEKDLQDVGCIYTWYDDFFD